jgi:hypothetical protein
MSRKKTAEQKLVEAIRELGLEKSNSIFKVLDEYNTPKVYVKRKPKLVEAAKA